MSKILYESCVLATAMVLISFCVGQAMAQPSTPDECLQNEWSQTFAPISNVPEFVQARHSLPMSIPSNGGILIDTNATSFNTIEIWDETGQPISGELIEVVPGKFVAWRPLEQFTADSLLIFSLIVDGNDYFGPQVMQIDPPWSPSVPDMTTNTVINVEERTGERCCDSVDGVQSHCYDVTRTVCAYAVFILGSIDRLFHMTQFVYQVVGQQDWQPYLPKRIMNVDGTDDEVCYELRMRHILTLDETEVTLGCAQVGELPKLGVTELDYTDQLSVELCQIPPDIDQEIWCEVNQLQCQAQTATSPGCVKYDNICKTSSHTNEDISDTAIRDNDAGLFDEDQTGERDTTSDLSNQDATTSDIGALPDATSSQGDAGCNCDMVTYRKADSPMFFWCGVLVMLLALYRKLLALLHRIKSH